jgi:hypothetical protein
VVETVAASPDRALEALLATTAAEMRLASILFFLRSLPAGPRRWAAARASRRRPLLDVLTATPGFLHLEGPADRFLAFGYVGRPWTPSGGGRRLTREEYLAFDEPGYAKVATDFRVVPEGSGSLLSTTTRIHLTDDHARRAFGRYWLLVRYGSWAVRKSWLRAARKRAEGSTETRGA